VTDRRLDTGGTGERGGTKGPIERMLREGRGKQARKTVSKPKKLARLHTGEGEGEDQKKLKRKEREKRIARGGAPGFVQRKKFADRRDRRKIDIKTPGALGKGSFKKKHRKRVVLGNLITKEGQGAQEFLCGTSEPKKEGASPKSPRGKKYTTKKQAPTRGLLFWRP